MLVVGVLLLLLLLVSGVPLFVAFAAGGAVILLYSVGMSPASIGQLLFASIDKYIFLSIPLFIWAGSLMAQGSSAPLVRMVNSLLARVPGGLSLSVVGSSGIFGALTGANAATAAAIGPILIPEMERRGYPRPYATALTASSACLGNLIPPSLTAIVYCGLIETSVAKQFLATVLPGALLMVFLAMTAMVIAWRRGYGERLVFSWREAGRTTMSAVPVLLMPALVLGTIYSGIATVTEAAAIACAYVIAIGIGLYKLTARTLWRAIINGARMTANIFLLIGTVGLLAKVLIMAQVPQTVAMWIVNMGLGQTGFLFMAVVVLVLLGTFLEAVPLILVTVPIFIGTLNSLGISPILYGALLALTVGIGQITPPVGVVLYVACGVGKAPIGPTLKEVLPFLLCQVAVTLLVVLFPPLATYLPGLVGVQ